MCYIEPLGSDSNQVYSASVSEGRIVFVLFLGCLTSLQHASVSQGRICSDNFSCCHTEVEVADQTLHLTQSQYTDTGPTSPSTDPTTPGAWQASHWSANFEVTGMTRPRKNPAASGNRTQDLPLSRRTPKPLGQQGCKSARAPFSEACLCEIKSFASPCESLAS